MILNLNKYILERNRDRQIIKNWNKSYFTFDPGVTVSWVANVADPMAKISYTVISQ